MDKKLAKKIEETMDEISAQEKEIFDAAVYEIGDMTFEEADKDPRVFRVWELIRHLDHLAEYMDELDYQHYQGLIGANDADD